MRSARSWSSSPRSALTRAAAALIRPSQRATGIGMGSPETGKLAIAFSVSGPHRACFSAASATAASVAPGRSDSPDAAARADRRSGVLDARRRLPEHRVVRPAADDGVGCAAGCARRLARGADELGALGRTGGSGARVLRASRRRSARDGGDRAERLDVRGLSRRVHSGRIAGAGARRRVHLAALPVPGAGAPRRDGAARRSARARRTRSARTWTSSRSAPCRWRRARSPTWTRSRRRRPSTAR